MHPVTCPWTAYHGNSPYEFPLCEQNVCALIRQPANTWSNLGMVVIGLYLIFRGLRHPSESDILLGAAIVTMGVCSFICHATEIPLFVALDVTAIFLFLSLVSALLLLRRTPKARRTALVSFLTFFLFACAVQLFASQAQILVLMLFIVLVALLEVKSLRGMGNHIHRRDLFIALVTLFVAALCVGLDSSKTFCFPDQHLFQFHALWHLLSGVSVLFIANYLRQFKIQIWR